MKKKLLTLSLVLIMVLAFSLSACGGNSSPSKSNSSGSITAASEKSESSNKAAKSSSSGTLGDYDFAIKDYKLVKDYEGKDAILINVKFTNNGEDATSFMVAGDLEVFQDGVELESTVTTGKNSENTDNDDKDIKTGASIDCAEVFVLKNKTSPVEAELSEFISFSDDKLVKTFNIAEK
jgi:uncharacterized lipoprotein YehR (DUF1307 family)